MNLTLAVILLALTMSLATAAGGLLALKSQERRHIVLGLSAGLLFGMLVFDLLPEVFHEGALELGGIPAVSVAMVAGFLALHFAERAFGSHEPHDSDYGDAHSHEHRRLTGTVGAVALAIHVFLDGMAIAVAFQVSAALGLVVTVAVLAHAFSDGLNTVSLVFRDQAGRSRALGLLGLDALARTSGAILGTLLVIPTEFVALYLALFAGFLTYLATSHILPEAHAEHPAGKTMLATLAGVVLMFAISAASHSALHGAETDAHAQGATAVARS